MNKWAITIIALLALMWVLSYFVLSIPMFSVLTFLWAGLIVTIVHKAGIMKVPVFNAKTSTYALVIFAIGIFMLGGLEFLGLSPAMIMGTGATGATIVPGTTISPQVPASGCAAGAQNYGEASTLTLHTYDMESNTPYSSEIDLTTNCFVYGVNPDSPNVIKASDFLYATDDTSNAQDTNAVSVGDTIKVICGGTSYYTDVISQCVSSAAQPVNLETHAIETESSIAATGYDDTATTALSAGTNSSQEDYDITMGADEEADFYIKWKVNSANNAWNFGGIAVRLTNDAKALTLKDSGYTKVSTPTFLDNIAIGEDTYHTVAGDNVTGGYDYVFKKDTPKMLHEWDDIKLHFAIESSSTDPATSNTFSSSDNIIMCALDAQYAKGDDGLMHLDVYTHDTGQSNVGMTEDFYFPVGKTTCLIIELI